ncbi:MAG: hypothetical protein U0350_31835 [Caldilineaceae bacterium]
MFSKQLLHSSIVHLSLIAVVLCSITLLGARSTEVALAARQESAKQHEAMQMQAIPNQSKTVFIVCHPARIATFAERIHVLCAQPVNGISFFAVSTLDGRYSARVLSVLLTAFATGKDLNIEYDPDDTSGSSFGCGADDCRKLLMAEVME